MKIGIAGVGGIGSNMAVNLVRSGIGPLKLVDMDEVEASNLNRQFYFTDQIGMRKVTALTENLQRISTTVSLESIHTEISRKNCRELFADCGLIVEGLDDQRSKKMLLEELAPTTRLIVSASGIAGLDLQEIGCRKFERCVVVGDFITDCSIAPLYLHKLQAICAHMTEILLKEIS